MATVLLGATDMSARSVHRASRDDEETRPGRRIVLKCTNGGEGEIRTHEPREGSPVFKTGAINRSATSPAGLNCQPILSGGSARLLAWQVAHPEPGDPLVKPYVLAILLLCLLPGTVLADEAPALSCPRLLEQLMTLNTAVPVYRLTPPDHREYLKDEDRPAELGRLQKLANTACSSIPREKQHQEAEAIGLHVALSPECTVERDLLTELEKPGSRESPASIADRRQLVAEKCPATDTTGLWLLKWDGRSELER
jgi:hypothetical protein